MGTWQRLLSNTALAFFSNIIVKASNTLLFIFIGRLIGPGEAGLFNLGVTYFTITLALSAWGLHELLVREVATRRSESRRYLVHYLPLRLGLTLLSYGLLLLFLRYILPYSDSTQQVIRVLSLAIFPEAIFMLVLALFAAHERLLAPTVAAACNAFLKVGVGLWVLFQGGGAIALAWVIVGSSSLSLLVLVPPLLRLFRELPQLAAPLSLQFAWTQLRFTPGFIIIGLFTTLDYQFDAFLISLLLTETELGWYGAAQTIMLGFWMMPTALRTAIYPLMARYYQESHERLVQLYRRTNRYVLLTMLPLCMGILLFSQPLLQLIFGPAFAPGVPALQWMIWAVIFSFLTVPNARLMLIAHRQKQAGWITGVGMIINVIFNLLLIPQYGIVGAAAARTLASAIFFLTIYLYVQWYLLQDAVWPLVGRPVLATGLMTLVIWQLRPLSPIGSIVIGAVVYLVAVWLLQVIPVEDRHYFRQLFKQR
ncbi:MAG: flippase [Anaerolineae bacterium]|nr:flippase [Anaerolineae bacterium]